MAKTRLISPEEFFRNKPLSVDHDGVIADTRSFVVQKVNELFGTNYIVSDINEWFWVAKVAKKHGMDEKSASALNDDLWFNPENLFQVPPTDEAISFMKWFKDRKLLTYIITSRNRKLKESTVAWYKKYMPFIDEKQIIMNTNSEPRGDFFKVWVIQAIIKPAIHIDDSPDHAQKIIEYTDTVVALMSNSRILDQYGNSQLIRLLDSSSEPISLSGVREKIVNHPIFK